MAVALYRRYRPDNFADLIGQEQVSGPLMTALRTGRVNHAYLFSGPRGCGKTSSARILARCLNCAEGPTDTPCGKCPSCIELATGGSGSLDVIEIDAASHNGVDDARDLRERAAFAPTRDRFKIFILDEAHMVTSQGFNALLKLVEEPPEHVKFIFATTEPEKVIGTIRSRTHHYPFRLVPPAAMLPFLDHILSEEKLKAEPGVLPLAIRAGGGSVRDTLSVLDQLIAASEGSEIGYERTVSLLGFTPEALISQAVDALGSRDAKGMFTAVERVIESGQDPRRFVEDLLSRFRDLILIAAVGTAANPVLAGVSELELDDMQHEVELFGPGQLSRAASVTNQALTGMVGAVNPRIQLELLCAKLLLPESDDTAAGTLARLDRLERRTGIEGGEESVVAPTSAPASHSDPAASPVPAQTVPAPTAEPAAASAAAPEMPAAGPISEEQLRSAWPQIVAKIESQDRSAWTVMTVAMVTQFEGDVLTLLFPNTGYVEQFKSGAGIVAVVREAIHQVLGIQVKFLAKVSPAAVAEQSLPSQASDSMAAPAPEPVAAPEPALAAEVDVEPVPESEPVSVPEPVPESVPEPKAAAKPKSTRQPAHQPKYGEAVLREKLGAVPIDENKK